MFQDKRLWNRIILNMVWGIVALTSVAEIMGLIYDSMVGIQDVSSLINRRFIAPTMWLVIISLTTEMVVRWSTRFADYCIMLMATLIPSVLIIYFPHITTVHNIQFLSILIAAFYYEKWKVYLSCILNVIVFLVLFSYNKGLNAIWTVMI